MLVYILLPAAALILFPLCRDGKSRFFCCAAVFAVLFAVGALRFGVGYDYDEYSALYQSLPFTNSDELAAMKTEKGFLLPLSWLAVFFPDSRVMFAVISAVTAAAVSVFVYRYSAVPAVSVLMLITTGLLFNSFNFMRQFLAALVILFAVRFVMETRFLHFAAYALFACMLHSSALVMLAFFFILKIRPNGIMTVIYAASAVLLYIYSDEIISLAMNFVYGEYAADPELTTGLPLACTIGFGVMTALAFLLRKMLVVRNKNNDILINCMYFAFLFELIGTKHAVVSRFSIYFLLPAALLLMPEIFAVLHKLIRLTFREKKQYIAAAVIASAIGLGLCGLFYGALLSDNYNGVTPYVTVFEEVSDAGGEI